ncbi:MAG: outer membrane beta-barrel domain-containing protein [Pseudomonadota bacterium]
MTNRMPVLTKTWLPVLLAIALALPGAVRAQDDDFIPPPPDEGDSSPAAVPEGPGEEPATPAAPREMVESEEAASPSQDRAPESAAKQDLESDETIYVIQKKANIIGGHFELSPQFVLSFNDRFTNHYGFMVAAMYHLRENVGVELAGGYLFGFPSEITSEIREKGRLAPEPVDLYALTWVATANVQWSPIYGKVSVLDLALGHYSLYFSVGTGMTGLALERYFDAPGQQYELAWPFAFTSTIGAGLRVYFLDWLGARIEVRDYVQANMVDKEITNFSFTYFDVQNYYMLQAGVTFIF